MPDTEASIRAQPTIIGSTMMDQTWALVHQEIVLPVKVNWLYFLRCFLFALFPKQTQTYPLLLNTDKFNVQSPNGYFVKICFC